MGESTGGAPQEPWWHRETKFLDRPLRPASRLMLVIVAVLFGIVAFLPLWRITLVAPQYQEGLRVTIYSYQLLGGNGGQDLVEINNLNHYIGMRPLRQSDFVEMKWLPFALGLFVLVALRAAAHGRMSQVLDLFFLFTYFGLFSMGLFYYRLYTYGHELDPTAPMTIEPFTPTLIGKNQIANFVQSSFPMSGAYLMGIAPLLLALAGWLSRKPLRPPEAKAGLSKAE